MNSVHYTSAISGSDDDLQSDNMPNSFFSLDSHVSGNSSPKISQRISFIGTSDYEPSMIFHEGKRSDLYHDLDSNTNWGGSLDISASKPAPVETFVPSINSDSKNEYTTLSPSIYEAITPVFDLPEFTVYEGNMLFSYSRVSTS